MYIYKAAVLGAGIMGAEIAQVITYSGLPVILKDVNDEAVQKGIAKVRKIYQERVDKGKMTSTEMEQKLALISGATDFKDFGDVDIVIEAVPEDMKIKQKVLQELEKSCPESTIFASNTSALSITEVASATKKPDKVIGMHFFNPAHKMKLVEVIPGLTTSQETVEDVVAFTESLRKIAVRVQECAGFLVNRILMPYLNEAVFAVQEGAATAKEVDDALLAFGMPMGPFALADMLGLDTAERVAQILYNAYGPRMAPAQLLTEIVKVKRFGTKTGAGFYNYEKESDDTLNKLIEKTQKQTGIKGTAFSPDRLISILINEAVICLQENVSSAADIDIAMMAGTGFPQDKGGPLHYADQIGLDTVLASLEKYAKELGFRFWPAPMLKRMAAGGLLGVKTKRGFFNY